MVFLMKITVVKHVSNDLNIFFATIRFYLLIISEKQIKMGWKSLPCEFFSLYTNSLNDALQHKKKQFVYHVQGP